MTVTDPRPAAVSPANAERSSHPARMRVAKRNGDTEPVDVNKIVRAVERRAGGLDDVDPMRVATRTISGLYDGASTAELDRLSIQTAAEMTGEEPQYSRLAARLLSAYIGNEVRGQAIASFSQSITLGHAEGLISDDTAALVKANARKLDDAIDPAGDLGFEYFGLRTVYDRYLLRHPSSRLVTETPQYFMLWTCRTSRSCRTSSSAGSPPTRSASPGTFPSTTVLKRTSHGPLRQSTFRLNGPWSPPVYPAFTRHRGNDRGAGRTGHPLRQQLDQRRGESGESREHDHAQREGVRVRSAMQRAEEHGPDHGHSERAADLLERGQEAGRGAGLPRLDIVQHGRGQRDEHHSHAEAGYRQPRQQLAGRGGTGGHGHDHASQRGDKRAQREDLLTQSRGHRLGKQHRREEARADGDEDDPGEERGESPAVLQVQREHEEEGRRHQRVGERGQRPDPERPVAEQDEIDQRRPAPAARLPSAGRPWPSG
jgi:hypothetical protein